MYKFAILIGSYSYIIFFLGLSHLLYNYVLEISLLAFLLTSLLLFKDQIKIPSFKFSLFSVFILIILILQIIVNFIGALGPETAYDALWYHLTIPKLFFLNHSISYIPGSLLYYSAMPKLAEMLYIPILIFSNEIGVKLFNFTFGLFLLIILHNFSRKFFDKSISLLVLTIFYANLVVDFESITAYIDLIWAFFTFLSFVSFASFYKSRRIKWLMLSAVLTGFAITTKLNGIELDIIYSLLLIYIMRSRKVILYIFLFILISLIIPLPWFIFAYINTHNPLFPFFSSIYPIYSHQSFTQFINPILIIRSLITLFLRSADPISPIYFISIPLIILYFKKFNKTIKLATIYSVLALLLWNFIPQTGGSRFIIPYLPMFSLVVGQVIFLMKNKLLKNLFVGAILFIAIISITYRGVANIKYFPVIFGNETKSQYLTNHLNFNFGDFYDTDNYFAEHIKSTDNVLLYGFHNLYYVDFPYVDASWLTKKDEFNYIAVQNTKLPKRFHLAKLIYTNSKTHVQLYKLPTYETI